MSRGNNGRNPDRATVAGNENKAVELRKAGLPYAQIADALGFASASSAYRTVMRALARNQSEQVEELRMIEGARLDRMQQAVWQRAVQGDLHTIDRVLRIMDRRARLFGLDAPQKVSVNTDEVDAQIEQLLAELASLPSVSDELPDELL